MLPKKLGDDMDIMDNTECKFNVNSFKMVYVVNSESYLYKRTALKRAREVCVLILRRFLLTLEFKLWVYSL